jgi:hypothetical protein
MIVRDLKTPLVPFELMINYKGKFDHHLFGADNEETFKKNLEKLGSGWRYSTKEITYSFNSLGYRTNELDYYKDKDFVLVLGASDVSGIGVPEEEIWHHQFKKKFNLEVINAGYGGSGTDLQLLNTVLFLKNFNRLPKAVVVYWPEPAWITFKGDNHFLTYIPSDLPTGYFSIWNKLGKVLDFYKGWLYDNNYLNNAWMFIESTRSIWKSHGIPYYDFTIGNDTELDIQDLNYLRVNDCHARDFIHMGHRTHEQVGLHICNELERLLNVR